MNKYEVNFKRLALLLLPTFWRKPLFANILYSIVAPLSELYTSFMKFRAESNYRMVHNGQVCHLRAVLNDMFDPGNRAITITDSVDNVGGLILYARELEKGKLLPRRNSGKFMIINRRGFDGVNGFDFWVNIPVAMHGKIDISRLQAIVSTYKLASKRFAVNYI